jgi:hypothetical protein
MQIFVNGVLDHCRRHRLDAELIIVEWNYPVDRPRLVDTLRWPNAVGPCAVRILEVPPERHRRLRHADVLPLFQMIAKNAGIRRAQGQFVLATNVDILFSDELMAFLASRRLETPRMYRIDRHDVMGEVPVEAALDEQLAYCRSHLLRLHTREGSFNLAPDGRRLPRPLWKHPLLRPPLRRAWRKLTGKITPVALHTNGCGDFTLLSRDRWFGLRGYPEFQMFSFHLDSLLCYAAHHAGAVETVLPEPSRIYHIEHAAGSGWTPAGHRALFSRLGARGVPWLDYRVLRQWAAQMRRYGAPMIFNRDDWGLADDDLRETRPGEPTRDDRRAGGRAAAHAFERTSSPRQAGGSA